MADELARLAVEVERAPRGSEELSARVLCAVLAPPGSKVERSRINGAWCVYSPTEYGREPFGLFNRWPESMRLNREVSTSLDAVVALIRERLPGALWATGEMEMGAFARLYAPARGGSYSGGPNAEVAGSATAPLALLAATLLALASQEKADA